MTIIYEFQINGTIRAGDDTEALTVLNFFKDNYASNINQLQIKGTWYFDEDERYKPIIFGMVFDDYTTMLNAVVAIKTAYSITPDITLHTKEVVP